MANSFEYPRGGKRLGALKLGRLMCLRQEYLHPGESIQPTISGHVRMAALREPISRRVHITLAQFWAPLRWYEPGIVDAVKQQADWTGSFTNITVGVDAPTNLVATDRFCAADALGVGLVNTGDSIWKAWVDNYLNVYKWYFKWPQDPDFGMTTGQACRFGKICVNLPTAQTRIMDDKILAADYQGGMNSEGDAVDLRVLSTLRARLRSETQKMLFGEDRYRDIIKEVWRARGSHEAEEVPTLLDLERGYAAGTNLQATDADGLGAVTGLMDFPIAHSMPFRFDAPEHGFWSAFLLLRYDPMMTGQSNLFLTTEDMSWFDVLGQPEYIANSPPVTVKQREIFPSYEQTTTLGVLPRGWQWRAGWDQVDHLISDRNSFPVHQTDSTWNKDQLRYHRDMSFAFRSAWTGNAFFESTVDMRCKSRIPGPLSSHFAGVE